MGNDNPERKSKFDGFSILIGALLAVFTQSVYDTFKTYYQLDYPILGPYFPTVWAGVVTAFFVLAIFLLRDNWMLLQKVFRGSEAKNTS